MEFTLFVLMLIVVECSQAENTSVGPSTEDYSTTERLEIHVFKMIKLTLNVI
jgi:hypothetical protein